MMTVLWKRHVLRATVVTHAVLRAKAIAIEFTTMSGS